MPQFETLAIPNFLKTEESQNFFLNAYMDFASELSIHDKNNKPKIKNEKRDIVVLEGDYTFSECGTQVSSYKRIMIYFEEYNGVTYLCKRTFKNEVRHISWVKRNLFSISDTLEVFNGNLKVAERVYSEGYSKKAPYILQLYFIDFLGNVHVEDVLNHEKLLITLLNDGRVGEMDGYEVKNINRVQYHKDGVMLTTMHTSFKEASANIDDIQEEYSQRLSRVDWNNSSEFNPRITEICRAKLDLRTGEFNAGDEKYTSMEEAFGYWSNAYKEYISDKENEKTKCFIAN